MNELIESYERKLKAIQPMIESAKFDEDTEREIRLRTKESCYRTFLSELKQQCNIADVVGRSEQLCDHPKDKRASIKSHGKDFCWECGKHIEA